MWKKVTIDPANTVSVENVTDGDLVVMITRDRRLCLLVREIGPNPHYTFKMLDRDGRSIGNGYDGYETEKTPAELIRHLERVGTFYVLDSLKDLGNFLTQHHGFDNS